MLEVSDKMGAATMQKMLEKVECGRDDQVEEGFRL
jgi:hypothetical protein